MKASSLYAVALSLSVLVNGMSLALADGEYKILNTTLTETEVKAAPQGPSYFEVFEKMKKSEPLYSFDESIAGEVNGETTKAHALKLFPGHFIAEIENGATGYIDTSNQQRLFTIALPGGQAVTESQLNLPKTKNVVIVPIAENALNGQLELCYHYHLEPASAWGYKQEFYSFAGGRVDAGFSALSAAMNELYEESGFQLSSTLKVLGYRHDTKIDALYFYVLINRNDIQEVAKNSKLPEVKQFFPFDYGFVPAAKKADMENEIAGLDKADKDFKDNAKKIEKKYKVKVLFPRQRGDFDSNGVFWSKLNLDVNPGERFVDFADDGRFGSFKNIEVLRDLQEVKKQIQ